MVDVGNSIQLKIQADTRKVVANGSVITAAGNNTSLTFQLANMNIILSFITDSSGELHVEVDKPKDAPPSPSLTLKLYNFNNSIGSGTVNPLHIGTLLGQKLWLAFVVFAMTPDSVKVVHYTFMQGD